MMLSTSPKLGQLEMERIGRCFHNALYAFSIVKVKYRGDSKKSTWASGIIKESKQKTTPRQIGQVLG